MKITILSIYIVSLVLLSQQMQGQHDTKDKDQHCVIKKIEESDSLVHVYVDQRNAIVGDMVLTESRNQVQARNSYGIVLSNLTVSDCDTNKQSTKNGAGTITSIKSTASNIIVNAKLSYNCGQNIMVDMEVDDQRTVNLLYESYGDYYYCNCERTVIFTINTGLIS